MPMHDTYSVLGFTTYLRCLACVHQFEQAQLLLLVNMIRCLLLLFIILPPRFQIDAFLKMPTTHLTLDMAPLMPFNLVCGHRRCYYTLVGCVLVIKFLVNYIFEVLGHLVIILNFKSRLNSIV